MSPVHSQDFYDVMMRRSARNSYCWTLRSSKKDRSLLDRLILAERISSHARRLRTPRIQPPLHFLHQHIPSLRTLSAPYMIHLHLSNTSLVDQLMIVEAGKPS